MVPNNWPMVSSRSSAMPERSSTSPMKVKNGNREQRVVVHHAVDALGQRLQEVRAELAELDADDGEEQADGAERKCCRIAEQQHDDERREHDRRHDWR